MTMKEKREKDEEKEKKEKKKISSSGIGRGRRPSREGTTARPRTSRERLPARTRPSSPSKKIFSSSSSLSSIPRIGLIGGSGLYNLPGLTVTGEVRVKTPFGSPSDSFFLGNLSSVPVAFLARHGRHHHLLPGEINYRANVWALKALGCSWVLSASACGSMKEAYRPTDIVLPDQFLDLTRSRVSTFFGAGCVGHVSFSHPVSPTLLDALEAAGKDERAVVHRGEPTSAWRARSSRRKPSRFSTARGAST